MAEPPSGAPPVAEKAPEDRLDSWKEIATYLKRDVTTVQRWEKRERMPVLTLSRGARRLRFLHGRRALVVMRGGIQHKDLWLIDLESGAERQLPGVGPG